MGRRNSILTLAASLVLASCPLQGQNETSMKMNEIKLDGGYIYAESAAGSKDEAYGMAMEDLAAEVNGLRREQGKDPVDMNALRCETKEIGFNRSATSYRTLLYLSRDAALVLPSAPDHGSGGIRLVDESILGTKKSSGEDTRREEPAPAKKDMRFVPSDTPENKRPASSPSSGTATASAVSGKMAGVARKLLNAGDLRELNEYMKECLSKGEVQECGAPKTLSDIPGDAYMIVYNISDYTITAILAPDGTNMYTMKAESLDDYAGHGVVWYR